MTEAVKLGMENENLFLKTQEKIDDARKAEAKLDIRLVYIKFVEDRSLMHITSQARDYIKSLGNTKILEKEQTSTIETFLDSKAILEAVIGQKLEDINSVEKIDFSSLKNESLETLIDKSIENSKEINSLEKELAQYELKKPDSLWSFDISGDVRYIHERYQQSSQKRGHLNHVQLGLGIVLGKNDTYEKKTTIEIAKKRSALKKQKEKLKRSIYFARQEYVKALKNHKKAKENFNQFDTEDISTKEEVKNAYDLYMYSTETLYETYKKYARLLHAVEIDKIKSK